eukprot:SAG31_NODE_16941_length_689_cov_1.681356_1_plen_116_part_00
MGGVFRKHGVVPLTAATLLASTIAGCYLHGWRNLIDEFACAAVVVAAWGASAVFLVPARDEMGNDDFAVTDVALAGFFVAAPAACLVAAFCEPWSTVEAVLIAALCAAGPIFARF